MIIINYSLELLAFDAEIGLCEKNANSDYYHDGTTGGGQYLNACTWFTTLFNRPCIGSTWRPTDYVLDEDKIKILQKSAYEAVINI
jgi:hypothetical protein